MHKLLVRQIRKFLSAKLAEDKSLSDFLEAISKSYADNDSKLEMVQRSTILSSQELSEANDNLRETADAQKKVIESLERSIAVLNTNSDGSFSPEKQNARTYDIRFL